MSLVCQVLVSIVSFVLGDGRRVMMLNKQGRGPFIIGFDEQ